MSDRATQGDATLATDVARWSTDPAFTPVFATLDGILLVLDAQGERVLHVSDRGAALRTVIVDAEGSGGRRLAVQVRSTIPPKQGARLVRIRFDARGIARPTTCVLARAKRGTGEDVLLLAPTEPLPALGRLAIRPSTDTEPEPKPETKPAVSPAPSGRFTWCSDYAGVLTQVAGIGSDLTARLTGRSWESLAESGTVTGPGLIEALGAHRTFRALPLVLQHPEADRKIAVELSGAPSARPAQPFAGFSGFGVIREAWPFGSTPVVEPTDTPDDEGPLAKGGEPASTDPTVGPVLPAKADDQGDADPSPAAFGEKPDADAPIDDVIPVSSETSDVQGAAVDAFVAIGDREDYAEPTTDLSTQEHAAFREIARALGARFAGDDAQPPSAPVPDAERRGAVMAFPVSATRSTSAAIDAAIVCALDRLPAGVLVHRGTEILYVNRRFLELSDYPDRTNLQAADALTQLLSRLPPQDDRIVSDMQVSLTTGGGVLLAVIVERSRVDWDGGPAELLLVRAAAQADQVREHIARGLLQARDTTRERDAQEVLDQIEDGVATLDDAGRVLGLNESAKAMLASDAREIVGGTLADLLAPESERAVAASLNDAWERGVSEPREATPRANTVPLRMRIVRLSATNSARFCVTLREHSASVSPTPRHVEPENGSRADFLARVRHEIRTPLAEMLAHAEGALAEKHGPLGSERYREGLRQIYHSTEHVLGVIDDLVDIARIEAGRGELTFTDIALNDVVSGCIALMQPQAARDRIVVRSSLSPDLRPLIADERSMRQATLNVIANAIRLTDAGGQVIVSTTIAERGEIAFRVRDTGIGMTQEEIERALAPLSRSDLTGGRNGTGLGLTLTKALVEANSGRFRITSRKNEGTLVEMLFPPPKALSA